MYVRAVWHVSILGVARPLFVLPSSHPGICRGVACGLALNRPRFYFEHQQEQFCLCCPRSANQRRSDVTWYCCAWITNKQTKKWREETRWSLLVQTLKQRSQTDLGPCRRNSLTEFTAFWCACTFGQLFGQRYSGVTAWKSWTDRNALSLSWPHALVCSSKTVLFCRLAVHTR